MILILLIIVYIGDKIKYLVLNEVCCGIENFDNIVSSLVGIIVYNLI